MANQSNQKLGLLTISDDVITMCAAKAVMNVPGVSQLSGGLTESISKSILGIENSGKGIKVSRSDLGLDIDIYVIVEYNVKIPQLAWEIQSVVKEAIENITDLKVLEVNIHVQGVDLAGEEHKE